MGTHPVIRSIGYRIGSWWIHDTGSGELLPVVAVTVEVGVGVGVVGWIEARRPRRNGLHPHVCVVTYTADERRALDLRMV